MFSLFKGPFDALARLQILAESGGLETYLTPGQEGGLVVRSKASPQYTQDEADANLRSLDADASGTVGVSVVVASNPDE